MKTLMKRLAGVAVLLSGMSLTAFAATTTGNLTVSATVLDTCTVTSASALTFASISATATTNETVPGNITILCTSPKTDVAVTLGGGLNVASGQRRMVDASSNLLPYSIFSNAGRTSSVAVNGEIYRGNLSAAVPVLLNVYGQVPSGNYPAGVYSDTVLVTLIY